jgi:hypothetical protein
MQRPRARDIALAGPVADGLDVEPGPDCIVGGAYPHGAGPIVDPDPVADGQPIADARQPDQSRPGAYASSGANR